MLDLGEQNIFLQFVIYIFDSNGDSMRKFLVVTAGLSLLATATINISDASAKWGCFAKNKPGGWGGSFGQESKERAAKIAIDTCKEANPKQKGCFITGCDPNIDVEADIYNKWSKPSPVKVRCGIGSDKKC